MSQAGETLTKSAFYGEPAQRCDAGASKIKGLTQLIQLKNFPVLFNQCFRRKVERVKGIEPSYAAWEAAVLPLNYTRKPVDRQSGQEQFA